MRQRIEQLPPVLQHEEVYRCEDFCRAFPAWEHETRRTIRGKRDFMLGDAAPDNEDEIGYNDEEDEEEDNEMEDVPPAIMKLEALVPDDYDED
jgi:hypothetical protein